MITKSNKIYPIAIVFYILMTLVANDLLIPSSLCKVSIIFLIIATIIYITCKNKLILIAKKYNFFWWYLMFVVVSIIAMLYSPDKSFLNDSSYLLYITLIILFCFCTLIDSFEKVIVVMKSYEWGSALLFGILYYTNSLFTDERIGGSFTGNSNTFALFMMVAFFFTSWLFFYYEKNKSTKIIAGVIMIMDFTTVLLSGARKSVIACMIYIVILFLYKKDKRGRRHLIRNIILIGLILFYVWKLMINNPYLYSIVGNRMENLIDQLLGNPIMIKGSSSYLREEYRHAAIVGWLKSPIWGHGYDSFHFYNAIVNGHNVYSHNNYTELLYNLGVIGFAVYYFEYLKLTFLGIKSINPSVKSITIAGMVGILLTEYGQVDYNASIIAIFLFVLYKLNIFSSEKKINIVNEVKG